MNNDLEQFSEEYLKELINSPADELTIALARIVLSVKQAKPVAYTDNLSLETLQGNGMSCMWKEGNGAAWREQIPLYTTPQPAHTEQDGWIKCSERMPDDGQIVAIINAGHGEIYEAATVTRSGPHFILMEGLEASNYDGGAVVTLSMEATHWMQLPAAPKPESE